MSQPGPGMESNLQQDRFSGIPRGEEPQGSSPLVRSPECYFFTGAITSLAALATRNFTTVLALILMASPVCGLRPMRALRSAFTRRPMPGSTKTPFFLVSLIAVSASRSRKAAACLLVNSSFSASCRVSAVLVSPVAMYCSPSGRALRAAGMVGLPVKICSPHGGRSNRNLGVAEPLYSCGYEEPCRWLQCGFEVVKVNGKTPNFHRFLRIFLDISPFSLVFAVFLPRRCDFGPFFLDESEELRARNHAIPVRNTRFGWADR